MENAIHQGPRFINSHYLSITKWKSNFVATKENLIVSVVWIRLPQRPTEFYDGKILEKFGNAIGRMHINHSTGSLCQALCGTTIRIFSAAFYLYWPPQAIYSLWMWKLSMQKLWKTWTLNKPMFLYSKRYWGKFILRQEQSTTKAQDLEGNRKQFLSIKVIGKLQKAIQKASTI